MAHITTVNAVGELVTVTGTGEYPAGTALTQHTTIASRLAVGDTMAYFARGVDGSGNPTGNVEWGIGTRTATGLARTTIVQSSNADAVVSWAASSTVQVFLTAVAAYLPQLDVNKALLLPSILAEPATPAASTAYLYARDLLPGYTVIESKSPSGIEDPLQVSVSFNRVMKLQPAGAALAAIGCATPTTTGSTLTAVTPASGTAKSASARTQFASGATAGNVAPLAYAAGIFPLLRGGVAGEGGFEFLVRIALNQMNTANRGFFGISDAVAVATNIDPTTSTTNGKVGLGFNANTGNWQLIRNVAATAPTVVDLGANFPIDTTSVIELLLYVRPFNTTAADIGYRVRRYTTNSDAHAFETSGTLSTNLPTAATILQPWCFMTNNATAAAVQWHLYGLAAWSDW